MSDKLREIARQITQDLQGDGFFASANNSYVHSRVERRLREALLAEPQPAPPSLSADLIERIVDEETVRVGEDFGNPGELEVQWLKVANRLNALLGAAKPVGGTIGLDGDTQRDWASDGPALEKRVKELEDAAPSGLSEFERSEIIRLASYSNNGDTVAEYVETLLGAGKPAEQAIAYPAHRHPQREQHSDYICPRCQLAVPENAPCPYCAREAELRGRVLYEATKIMCERCKDGERPCMVEQDDYISNFGPVSVGNWIHGETLARDTSYCEASYIHSALKSQVSVTGQSNPTEEMK